MSAAPAFLFPGASAGVLGVDADSALGLIAAAQRAEDEAAARKLAAVAHWADLHRTDEEGAVDPAFRSGTAPVEGIERELALAGEGTFAVEEFAVCEVAAALGMSEPAARRLVGEALELRDRLPRCWARVMAGALPAWKGRQIAAETIALNEPAAAYVDAHLAPFAARMSLRRILRAVHAATVRHDPALAAERAAAAAESRGVWRVDEEDGTSTVTVVADTPDAAAFDTTLDEVATALGTLGDARPAQARRATAVGVLADPQLALTLLAPDPNDPTSATRPVGRGPVFHLHLHHDALTGASADPVARVTGFGARSLEVVRRWLSETGSTAPLTVTPVVDLTAHHSVDAYEVPDRLRTQVAERDHGCVFPWCGRHGAFDADHIDPYVPPDDGGPPGQTNTANLARLCRFHHRVKTHSTWHYQRLDQTSYRWTSPHGRTYTVDEHGTSTG